MTLGLVVVGTKGIFTKQNCTHATCSHMAVVEETKTILIFFKDDGLSPDVYTNTKEKT